MLTGNGSEIADSKQLESRAKRKIISQAAVLKLVDATKNKPGRAEQRKAYWNTWHCQSKIYLVNGRLYGKYCKNRHCTLCCENRKADLINRYLPVILELNDPYFVTLTAKSVGKESLYERMRQMVNRLNRIKDKYRKRNLRGTGIKFIGVRSLECNFNPATKKYKPHFHLIVANKETAEILVAEWLKKLTSKFASPLAQKAELIRNKEKTLVEIIKHGTKIFTEPDVNNKSGSIVNRTIYVAAMDNIFSIMKGLRIFERFGFNLPASPEQESPGMRIATDYETLRFSNKNHDWINKDTGECLTNYSPDLCFVDLLKNRIDTELE